MRLRQILRQIAGKAGLRYEEQDSYLIGSWLLFAHERCGEWWNALDWPEIVVTEKRSLTVDPDAGAKYLEFARPGEEVIRDLLAVYREDPRGQCPPKLDWTAQNGSAWLRGHVPDTVWVVYKPEAPMLAGVVDDGDTPYVAGDPVYFDAPGDVYLALADTLAGSNPVDDAGAWERVMVPRSAERWLVNACYADWLADQGELEKSRMIERSAQAKLDEEILRFVADGRRFGVG